MNLTPQQVARKIAAAASDKKARDILLLKLAEEGILPSHTEGYAEGRWILMDYGDCVAHIFLEEDRDFYNLEQLWADAPSESFAEEENE